MKQELVGSKEEVADRCWANFLEQEPLLSTGILSRGLVWAQELSIGPGEENRILALVIEQAWKEGFCAAFGGFEAGAFSLLENN